MRTSDTSHIPPADARRPGFAVRPYLEPCARPAPLTAGDFGSLLLGFVTLVSLVVGAASLPGCVVYTRSRGGYSQAPPPRRGPPPHAPAHGYRHHPGRGRGTVEVR
jgi:hypothetical protein